MRTTPGSDTHGNGPGIALGFTEGGCRDSRCRERLPDTHHIIGAAELALLPRHAVLVNVARGSLLDHDALVLALNTDALWGAALDVTDPEPLPADHTLWQIPRCVITSHSADTPLMTAHLLGTRIERNVRRSSQGRLLSGLWTLAQVIELESFGIVSDTFLDSSIGRAIGC